MPPKSNLEKLRAKKKANDKRRQKKLLGKQKPTHKETLKQSERALPVSNFQRQRNATIEKNMQKFMSKLNVLLRDKSILKENVLNYKINDSLIKNGVLHLKSLTSLEAKEQDPEGWASNALTEWNSQTHSEKVVDILQSYGKEPNIPDIKYREKFILNFMEKYTLKQIQKFIKDYVDNDSGKLYYNFYNDWVQRPEIIEMTGEDDEEQILKDAVVEASEQRRMELRLLTRIEKKYKEFLEERLSNDDWDEMKIDWLFSSSSRPIKNKDGEMVMPKKRHMTQDEINTVLKRLPEDDIPIIASKGYFINTSNKTPRQIIRQIIKQQHPRISRDSSITISDRDVMRTWVYQERIKQLTDMTNQEVERQAVNLNIDIGNEEKNTKKKRGELIIEILDIERKQHRYLTDEKYEREELIKKIHETTNKPVNYFQNKTIEELRDYYRIMSQGKSTHLANLDRKKLLVDYSNLSGISIENIKLLSTEELYVLYSEELESDKIVKKLGRLTGQPERNFRRMPYQELINELESHIGPNIEDPGNNEDYLRCLQAHREMKWIKARITGVWLQTERAEYKEKEFITVNGNNWYQANEYYFELQCNNNSYKRTQNKQKLSCYTELNQKVDFMVAYTVTGYQHQLESIKSKYSAIDVDIKISNVNSDQLFFIQDETVFNDEKKYLRKKTIYQKNASELESINDILLSRVNDDSEKIVRQALSSALLGVAPHKSDYGTFTFIPYQSGEPPHKLVNSDTHYNNILIKSLRSRDGRFDSSINTEQTNKQFFHKASELIIFLNSIPEAKIFKERIKMEYYLPDILPTLSYEEKFSELYNTNTSDKYLREASYIIQNRLKRSVSKLSRHLYKLQNPTVSISGEHNMLHRNIKTTKK